MGIIQQWKENRTLDSMLREERVELATEVSEDVVRKRISYSIKRNDFQALRTITGYFPQVKPDYTSVQKAYGGYYSRKDLQSAHKLFDILGIEPNNPLSENITQVSNGRFRAVVVKKEIKRRPLIKDKYIITIHLPNEGITFRRKVTPEEFYQDFQEGSAYQITVPILQKMNMLGHNIGKPYISPSNLLFG